MKLVKIIIVFLFISLSCLSKQPETFSILFNHYPLLDHSKVNYIHSGLTVESNGWYMLFNYENFNDKFNEYQFSFQDGFDVEMGHYFIRWNQLDVYGLIGLISTVRIRIIDLNYSLGLKYDIWIIGIGLNWNRLNGVGINLGLAF